MQHIINKQVIELRLNKTQDAFRMQHLISNHYYNEMLPLLESVFNEYSREDEVLVLDKLEIDFGTISEKDLEKNSWDEDLLSKLKIKLKESLASVSAGEALRRESRPMNNCRQWIFYMQHGYLSWNTLAINEQWYNNVLETLAVDYAGITLLRKLILSERNIAFRIVMQHDELFLRKLTEILTAKSQKKLVSATEEIYLVLGKVKTPGQQLPAPAIFKKALWQQVIRIAASSANDLSAETIIETVLHPYASQLPAAKRRQKELLSSVTVIREVLARLFQLQSGYKNNIDIPAMDAGNVDKNTNTDKLARKDDKESTDSDRVIEKTGADEYEAEDISINNRTGEKHDKKQGADPTKKEKEGEENKISKEGNTGKKDYEVTAENKIPAEPLEDKTETPLNINSGKQELKDTFVAKDEDVKQGVDSPLLKDKFNNKKEDAENQQLNTTIPEEGIFITNVGIVLAHPFIGFLFTRLQLIKDSLFTDTDARLKAIFLLHYLATGKTTAEEYDLVICKFLCSYPINEPLPAEMIFTDAELEEATGMLTALIQQWDKLKGTSIAGLREGFLQRNGKLFVKNDSPYVQVESSPIDVLLDYLPWNLSIIKLPWMKEIVRVEWR